MKNFSVEVEGKTYWISRSIAVLAIVLTQDTYGNKYVLANKRGVGAPDFVGKWNIPCGYLDYGETLEEAAKREVFEETGFKIKTPLSLYGIDSDPLSNRQNVTIRFTTQVPMEVALNSNTTTEFSENNEVSDIAWINLNYLNSYEWAFNHYELLKNYKDGY